MKKIVRSWWETDVYDLDIEDVIARVVQVADKLDEIVDWINEQEKMLAEELDDDYLIRGRKIDRPKK